MSASERPQPSLDDVCVVRKRFIQHQIRELELEELQYSKILRWRKDVIPEGSGQSQRSSHWCKSGC